MRTALLCLLLLTACGESPIEPEPITASGTWTGRIVNIITADGVQASDINRITLELTEAERISGHVESDITTGSIDGIRVGIHLTLKSEHVTFHLVQEGDTITGRGDFYAAPGIVSATYRIGVTR